MLVLTKTISFFQIFHTSFLKVLRSSSLFFSQIPTATQKSNRQVYIRYKYPRCTYFTLHLSKQLLFNFNSYPNFQIHSEIRNLHVQTVSFFSPFILSSPPAPPLPPPHPLPSYSSFSSSPSSFSSSSSSLLSSPPPIPSYSSFSSSSFFFSFSPPSDICCRFWFERLNNEYHSIKRNISSKTT